MSSQDQNTVECPYKGFCFHVIEDKILLKKVFICQKVEIKCLQDDQIKGAFDLVL